MKKYLSTLFFAALAFIASPVPSPAQTQQGSIFIIKIDGVSGESTQPGHVGEVDVFSFNLGVTQRGVSDFGGGASAGKSQFLPVVLYKNVDIASPALFLACATGKHIPKVTLFAIRRLQNESFHEYLTVTLTDVLVSSVNHQSADSNGVQSVLESVSINYAKIEISYEKQNADSSFDAPIKAGYDVKANKKL